MTTLNISGFISPLNFDAIVDTTRRRLFEAVRDSSLSGVVVSGDEIFEKGCVSFSSLTAVRENAGRFEVFNFMSNLYDLVNHVRVKDLDLHGTISLIVSKPVPVVFRVVVSGGIVSVREAALTFGSDVVFDPSLA